MCDEGSAGVEVLPDVDGAGCKVGLGGVGRLAGGGGSADNSGM